MKILQKGKYDSFFNNPSTKDFRPFPQNYLPLGSSFFGFILPSNFCGSKSEFYEHFGLFDNKNSVGAVGNRLSLFRQEVDCIILKEEPFLNDFILINSVPNYICSGSVRIDKLKGMFELSDYSLSFSPLLPSSVIIDSNLYFDAIESIAGKGFNEFIQAITKGMSGRPETATQWALALPSLIASISKIKAELTLRRFK
ncbi:MAG: hypothetical protein ACRCYP_05275 [Alphaproteobacteria bacterium]